MQIEDLIKGLINSEEYQAFLKKKEELSKSGHNIDKRFAIFKDMGGNINVVEIFINMGQCFHIDSKNEQGENTRIYEDIF